MIQTLIFISFHQVLTSGPQTDFVFQVTWHFFLSGAKRAFAFDHSVHKHVDIRRMASSIRTSENDIIAYEPVVEHRLIRRRPATTTGLRVCRAKLTLTFSVYVVTGGTLLTAASLMLSGFLFLLAFFAISFSAFVAATWIIFHKTFSSIKSTTKRLTPAFNRPAILSGDTHHDRDE